MFLYLKQKDETLPRSFRYQEIAADIRQKIQQNIYPPQARLPSERTLMEQYQVQRNTIRQALALLQKENRIQVQPRSGFFVVPFEEQPTPANIGSAPLPDGVVLVINSWNRFSNALDRILSGLSQSLHETPLILQRFNSQPLPGQWLHRLPTPEYLAESRVVGAVLWPQSPTDPAALARLRDLMPLVVIDRRILGFEADCVRTDDIIGGEVITNHLIAQGHRRIGFLGDEVFAESVQHRWQGYTRALQTAEIPLDAGLYGLFEGLQTAQLAERLRLFLAGDGLPLTAVVCSNDSTAVTLLRFLREENRRVPDDVAVTGYGNLLPDYMDTLALTTMSQPFETVGRVAGELLCKRLQSSDKTFQQIELPVELIVRNSSQKTIADAKLR